jgi:hypothetical protein
MVEEVPLACPISRAGELWKRRLRRYGRMHGNTMKMVVILLCLLKNLKFVPWIPFPSAVADVSP